MERGLPKLKCGRCGHVWTPVKKQLPKTCPNRKCNSPYWNKERKYQRQKIPGFKWCPKCKAYKPYEKFGKCVSKSCGLQGVCKQCQSEYAKDPSMREHIREYQRTYNHTKGKARPMSEAKDCSDYLGIHIAERILSKFFDNIERMPANNPGFDFKCSKGKRIDVKSACRLNGRNRVVWNFNIRRNKTPDFFLCIAFDNRESLNPEHVWLIPAIELNTHNSVSISEGTTDRWKGFEKPLDKVITCCNAMRNI